MRPLLGARAANLLLFSCLFGGLFAGGLRDPLLAAPFLAALWLAALLGPAVGLGVLRPFLAALAWVALSLLSSPEPLTGLSVLGRWAALAGFWAMASAWWGRRERERWFWLLAGCGLAVGAASWLVEVPSYDKVGILPFYYNYTVFVTAAVFSAALSAALRPDGPAGWRRWACAGAAAGALAQIIWACSRGGLVAAAAGAAVFAWRHLPRRRLLPLALAAAVALAGGLILATRAKSRVSRSFKRPQIWMSSLAIVRDHPVLGAGPGQFANSFLQHNFPAGYGVGNYRARADHAHSEVLEAAADFGIPGLLLLLAALGLAVRAGPRDWTGEAALAAFAAMSVQCLADNMLHIPSLGLLYASALACAGPPAVGKSVRPAPAELPMPQAPARGREDGGWRALAWAGLLLAAVSWVPGRLAARWGAQPGVEGLRRAVRLAPADPYLREGLARAWLGQEPPRPDEALVQIEAAARMNPTNAVYPVMCAEILRSRGDWPGVLEASRRALALEPLFLQAYLLEAESLAALGRRGGARAALQAGLRMDRELDARRAEGHGRVGWESILMGFDRARYAELARALGPS